MAVRVIPVDRIYKLELVRAGEVWTATLPEVQGCHTYGKTIEEARERIREALEVSLTDHTPEEAAKIASYAYFEEHVVYNPGKEHTDG